jgi:hypothetical protein
MLFKLFILFVFILILFKFKFMLFIFTPGEGDRYLAIFKEPPRLAPRFIVFTFIVTTFFCEDPKFIPDIPLFTAIENEFIKLKKLNTKINLHLIFGEGSLLSELFPVNCPFSFSFCGAVEGLSLGLSFLLLLLLLFIVP